MPIIRYTTPTLKFTFSDIDVTNITSAYLVIKQSGRAIIERDLTTANVVHSVLSRDGTETENYLSWLLTQTETSKLGKTNCTIYCDWKLQDGTRGRSHLLSTAVEDSGKQEVI